MRYSTRQHDSTTGEAWREVYVKAFGHVSETDMGYNSNDPRDVGWWCVHNGVLKFFLKRRILEVDRAYDYSGSPHDYPYKYNSSSY